MAAPIIDGRGEVSEETDREAGDQGSPEERSNEAGQALPAFQMPSQMPKELQSWAWDK